MRSFVKFIAASLLAVCAFSACEKASGNENSVEFRKVSFKADMVETKSVFGEKTETGYPSLWTKNKQVAIYVADKDPVYAVPLSAGVSTSFDAELPTANSGKLRVFSPKGVYTTGACEGGFTQGSIQSTYKYAQCVVPANQTPIAGSCDEAVHFVAGTMDIPSTGIPETVEMSFASAIAYGKLTIKNLPIESVREVTLTFPMAVAGNSCRYMFESGNIENASDNVITLNASDITKGADGNFVLWFGCAPARMSSGTMIVAVTGMDGLVYKKTADFSASNVLTFETGKVRPIGVDMTGIIGAEDESAPIEVETDSFTSVSGNLDDVISYEAAKGGAATAPGVYNNEIRVYQNGGIFTVTAAEGYKIKSIVLGSSLSTKVTCSVDDGPVSGETSIAANSKVTFGDYAANKVVFTCVGTTQNTRLYVNYLKVTYVSGNGSSAGSLIEVTTGDATSITTSSAMLNASYSGASAAPQYSGFYWGTSSFNLDRDTQNSTTTLTGTEGDFSVTVDGLTDGTTYYYQAYVKVLENGVYKTYNSSEVKSFRTKSVAAGTSGIDWFELPLMNYTVSGNYKISTEDKDNYYAYHWCDGGEKGPSGKTARNFTVCFSAEHHSPLWVAAPRHAMYVGSAGRNDAYRPDDLIPADIQYYSKDVDSGCNKGHMLGSAERTSSVATNKQVFYYSNIAPQYSSGYNTGGGGWNMLEDWVDTKVCADTLYEVVGCYYDQFTDGYKKTASPKVGSFGGRDDVGIPTMFYYLLLRTKDGSTGKSVAECTSDELMCAAFVRTHTNELKGQAVTSKEMMSVSDLEKITGFTYFVNVPNAPKDKYNPSDWGL